MGSVDLSIFHVEMYHHVKNQLKQPSQNMVPRVRACVRFFGVQQKQEKALVFWAFAMDSFEDDQEQR